MITELPARFVRLWRQRSEMTQQDVADRLGIHVTNYNRLETGKTKLSMDKLMELAAIFNCTPVDLLGPPVALRHVLVAAHVQAGYWSETNEWPAEMAYDVAVPDDVQYRSLRLYGAESRGDSMNLIYPEGTSLVFAPVFELGELKPGKRYHVRRTRADGLREETVKTLWVDPEGRMWLKPESSDPRFSQLLPLDGDDGDTIEVLGQVVFAVRRE